MATRSPYPVPTQTGDEAAYLYEQALLAPPLDYDAIARQLFPAEPEPTYEEPSYDGGGTTYVYPAAPTLGRLDDSPEWQAYNAELDRAMAFARADADRRKGLVTSERDRLMGEL